MIISLLVMGVLIAGIRFSSVLNQIVVAIKLLVVAAVILVGVTQIDPDNYTPFIPKSQPAAEGSGGFMDQTLISTLLGIDPAVYGMAGVIAGASIVFFAFIGFDIVATTAEETKNPQRDIPRGILGSLAIVTVLYMAVSLVITGMQNYADIDPNDGAPLSTAFDAVGMDWMGNLIAIGACIGLIVVVMILMLGQTRVGFAMARDGLLPVGLAKVHPKFGTPYIFTAITGVAVALIGGLVDLETLVHLVSIGTLFAFVLVSVGRGDPAPQAPRPPAVLPDPGDLRRLEPVGAAVRLPDAQPDRRHLGAVRRLDGDRAGRLLHLRLQAQQARPGGDGRPLSRAADPGRTAGPAEAGPAQPCASNSSVSAPNSAGPSSRACSAGTVWAGSAPARTTSQVFSLSSNGMFVRSSSAKSRASTSASPDTTTTS